MGGFTFLIRKKQFLSKDGVNNDFSETTQIRIFCLTLSLNDTEYHENIKQTQKYPLDYY